MRRFSILCAIKQSNFELTHRNHTLWSSHGGDPWECSSLLYVPNQCDTTSCLSVSPRSQRSPHALQPQRNRTRYLLKWIWNNADRTTAHTEACSLNSINGASDHDVILISGYLARVYWPSGETDPGTWLVSLQNPLKHLSSGLTPFQWVLYYHPPLTDGKEEVPARSEPLYIWRGPSRDRNPTPGRHLLWEVLYLLYYLLDWDMYMAKKRSWIRNMLHPLIMSTVTT